MNGDRDVKKLAKQGLCLVKINVIVKFGFKTLSDFIKGTVLK